MLPSSQWVSIMFPKGVPNSTSLYLISFAQNFPLVTYIGEPQGEALDGNIEALFWEGCMFHIFSRADQNGPLQKIN
jgi:hypothetical protein